MCLVKGNSFVAFTFPDLRHVRRFSGSGFIQQVAYAKIISVCSFLCITKFLANIVS